MKLLLDTCAFLWILFEPTQLSELVRDAVIDPGNEVYLSAVSAWEIAVKHALGKLPLPAAPELLVAEQREAHGIVALPLDERAALFIGRLPPIHRDPFDRMLTSQALSHGMTIVTPDPVISKYAVNTVW
jgi:PIN domain nuclease of toxin-antitoxin system